MFNRRLYLEQERGYVPAKQEDKSPPRCPGSIGNQNPLGIASKCTGALVEERSVATRNTLINVGERQPTRETLGTEEREEQRKGQACAREQRHDRGEVLRIKEARLCERVAQRALSRGEDGVRVDARESRGADVLEEAKVVVRGHGDKVESRRGEVDGKHERTT